jgi:hypothetical protein
MFESMTTNIKDSRLALESLVLSAKSHVESIREPLGEDVIEIKASYEAPTT